MQQYSSSEESDEPPQWRTESERVLVLAEALADARAADVEVDAGSETSTALARARVLAMTMAPVRARVRALAHSLTQSEVEAVVRAAMKARAARWGKARVFTYGEISADSEVMDIIDSIKPDQRHQFTHDVWQYSPSLQEVWWLIQIVAPITRLPSELLQQILLLIIDDASDSPLVLMQVSKHWYTIVTGIWASLKLGTTTPKSVVTRKLERNQWLLDVLVDTEIDRGNFTPSKDAYQAIFAALEATSRFRSLVLETFPAQADLPEDLVNRGLQQCSNPVMSRLGTFKIKSACEMSPLLDHLLCILGTTASEELTIVEINSANVITFLVPSYSSIFRSVTVLTLDASGLPNPVDLLPHLHQLESLTASHLHLPVYHDDADLPFVHTLRHLRLRSASVQWMSGRTFHALESCTIIFPRYSQILHTFHTTLPHCKDFSFEGYPLDILEGVSTHNLVHLDVTCSSFYKPRGNRQLVRFSSQALQESRLTSQILHISIEATSEAWVKALSFMSNLEELVIHNAQPSSLGVKALQSLVVHPIDATDQGTTSILGGRSTPICPLLKRFGLRYRRWLRPNEPFDLIPVFRSIIRSRQESMLSLQSFRIWTRSGQSDPWELIEKSSISSQGFEHLRIMVSLKDGTLNLPMPYDDLSALSPVVRREVLSDELLKRVRETERVEDYTIDRIVRSMMMLPFDQIVCGLQDRDTFLAQVENCSKSRVRRLRKLFQPIIPKVPEFIY